MTGFLHSALEHAETYRAAAIERSRKSGGSTVRVYATSRTMDAARGGTSEGGQIAFTVRQRWQIMRDDAVDVPHRGARRRARGVHPMVKPYQHLLFQPEIQRRAELPAGTVFDYGGRPLLICKVLGTDKAAPVIVEELTDAVALKGQLGIWSVDGVARQMTRKR